MAVTISVILGLVRTQRLLLRITTASLRAFQILLVRKVGLAHSCCCTCNLTCLMHKC